MDLSPVAASFGVLLVVLAGVFVWKFVVVPLRLASFYQAQGLAGTPWRFFVGDMVKFNRLRNTSPEPFIDISRYFSAALGPVGYMWFGPSLRLRLHDAALAREILVTHSYKFFKHELAKKLLCPFLGDASGKPLVARPRLSLR